MGTVTRGTPPTKNELMVVEGASELMWQQLNALPPDLRFAVVGVLVVNIFVNGVKPRMELETFDDFVKHQRSEIERMAKDKAKEHRL